MDIGFSTILCGIAFGGVGIAVWRQGRKAQDMRKMALGVALIAFTYVVPGDVLPWVVGCVLTGLVFWP